jgi:DNA invertase Pin-like site-specific DNA recombinase
MQAHSGISLDEQRRKIEARCVEMGWHLDHVFVDAGVSGGTLMAKRPQGAKLLAIVRPATGRAPRPVVVGALFWAQQG